MSAPMSAPNAPTCAHEWVTDSNEFNEWHACRLCGKREFFINADLDDLL